MKKYVIILGLFISMIRTEANPLPDYTIVISELQFRADGSWILEIEIPTKEGYYAFIEIEEIWIKSNSGESKIKNFIDNSAYQLFVVESDSLETPLFINPLQDIVRLFGTVSSYPLIYGYPNSQIRTPKEGQSIASIGGYGLYSITNSPTIGRENDITGMLGTVKGVLYDTNGLPLINMDNMHFTLGYEEFIFLFSPQSDGSYSARSYSYDYVDIYNLSYLRYPRDNPYDNNYYRTVSITPIQFSMQPDSVVIQDIYLSGNILTGINEANNNTESILKIYPQPIQEQLFHYEISIPIKSLETYMIFYNVNGHEVYRFLVTKNNGTVLLPPNIKNGFYIAQLASNKKIYANAKIIVQ